LVPRSLVYDRIIYIIVIHIYFFFLREKPRTYIIIFIIRSVEGRPFIIIIFFLLLMIREKPRSLNSQHVLFIIVVAHYIAAYPHTHEGDNDDDDDKTI